jgi:hypothetical protein
MFAFALALCLTAAPEVAILSSRGEVAELRFQPLNAAELTEPVARFSHGEGSDVKGSLLPRTRVVVASAAMRSTGDLSFANALVRLEAGKPARVLAENLAYGSRPLVTAEGRVFVSRGVAGAPPIDARETLRVDQLSVEEIDATTAARRLIYSTLGYITFLAGAAGRELIIYEVAPSGARLLCVHADTLAVRELLPSMAPLARDFTVDAVRGRVVFTQGTAFGDRWLVEEVELSTGKRRQLAEGPEVTLLPAVLTDGRVLISRAAGEGLFALDGTRGVPAHGRGFERLVGQHKGLQIFQHETPSEFPALFTSKGPLLTPLECRLDVAGVTP